MDLNPPINRTARTPVQPPLGIATPDTIATADILYKYHARYPARELYEGAVNTYEQLLAIAEHADAAKEISLILNIPASRLQEYAARIMDLLLSDRTISPSMSLGLPEQGSLEETARRWKRLVILNHPDRHRGQHIYEEKTKLINEAYERILSAQKNAIPPVTLNPLQNLSPVRTYRVRRFRYLRHVPAFIVSAAAIIALMTLLFFIWRVLSHTGTMKEQSVMEKIYTPSLETVQRPNSGHRPL